MFCIKFVIHENDVFFFTLYVAIAVLMCGFVNMFLMNDFG